jgi:putative transposase
MRYDLVEAHRGRWPVRLMCRVPRGSPGGYYDWRGRPASARAERRAAPVVAIKAIHGEVKARHGSPRIHAELAARGKSRGATDWNHDRPVAEDVVDRHFEPTAADRTWAADITSIPTAEGWPYLAAVEGLYSRKIVGWSMGPPIDGRPVVDALEMALAARRPGRGLVAHSDRGGQYASEHDRGLLVRHGITCSMGRRANCRDDAPTGSFFASPKKELTHGEAFATREEARSGLFEPIEVFFDRIRRHSSLGYPSPVEYERAGQAVNPAPAIGGVFQADPPLREARIYRNEVAPPQPVELELDLVPGHGGVGRLGRGLGQGGWLLDRGPGRGAGGPAVRGPAGSRAARPARG